MNGLPIREQAVPDNMNWDTSIYGCYSRQVGLLIKACKQYFCKILHGTNCGMHLHSRI